MFPKWNPSKPFPPKKVEFMTYLGLPETPAAYFLEEDDAP